MFVLCCCFHVFSGLCPVIVVGLSFPVLCSCFFPSVLSGFCRLLSFVVWLWLVSWFCSLFLCLCGCRLFFSVPLFRSFLCLACLVFFFMSFFFSFCSFLCVPRCPVCLSFLFVLFSFVVPLVLYPDARVVCRRLLRVLGVAVILCAVRFPF